MTATVTTVVEKMPAPVWFYIVIVVAVLSIALTVYLIMTGRCRFCGECCPGGAGKELVPGSVHRTGIAAEEYGVERHVERTDRLKAETVQPAQPAQQEGLVSSHGGLPSYDDAVLPAPDDDAPPSYDEAVMDENSRV